MPITDCNKPTAPHKDSASGHGKRCSDAQWEARENAIRKAMIWGLAEAEDCLSGCRHRTVSITLTLSDCTQKDAHPGLFFCTCDWTATVECKKDPVSAPAGKTEVQPSSGHPDCTEYVEAHGTGKSNDQVHVGEAKAAAVSDAKDKALEEVKKVPTSCPSKCPHPKVTVSLGEATAKITGTGAQAVYEATCDWKLIIECSG
ncbi:MAG: hypothetical protein P4M04_03890 [Acidobacteriota bacterium]|nr:hypothetical protein [Acidobacteriota bacterium]